MNQKVIALSADYGYINQITTLIKSILYHNHDVDIYVINTDIPQEWFSNVNNRIASIGSRVLNMHIDENLINNEHVSQPQINALSYGRILIPRLIDADRVLYLDSDIVVDDKLDELFTIDLGDHPVAAIPDVIYHGDFNSGVMIFNNRVLRQIEPDIVDQMLEAGKNDELVEGDQSVLNSFFNKTYLHLGYQYNYVIGYDFLNFYYPTDYDLFDSFRGVIPKIIHFTGPQKPWELTYSGRLRDSWWRYANLEWSEVVHYQPLPDTIDYSEAGQCLIFTRDENIAHLKDLVTALPNVTFNVAAWTSMGWHIMKLIRYSNVHLFPSVVGPVLTQLEKDADCYLDINQGPKEESVINTFVEAKKPILTFKGLADQKYLQQGAQSFDDRDWSQMANTIKQIIKK